MGRGDPSVIPVRPVPNGRFDLMPGVGLRWCQTIGTAAVIPQHGSLLVRGQLPHKVQLRFSNGPVPTATVQTGQSVAKISRSEPNASNAISK